MWVRCLTAILLLQCAACDLLVYGSDAALENPTCLEYGNIESDSGGNFIRFTPNKWHDGRLKIGSHSSTNCWPSALEYSEYQAICFSLRGMGMSPECSPRFLINGGYPFKTSKEIDLSGSTNPYVSSGQLDSTEFREVCIPIADLQDNSDGWDLSRAHYTTYLRFKNCVDDPQPTYEVRSVRLLSDVPVLETAPPAPPTPTPVPQPPVIPTHHFFHGDWVPILNSTVSVGAGETWPTDLEDGDCVSIESGATVVYSQASSPRLECIIVRSGGELRVDTSSASDVELVVGTIMLEAGRFMAQSGPGTGVTVTFDGKINRTTDPGEMLVGLVSLDGQIDVEGEERCGVMVKLAAELAAGSGVVMLEGRAAFDCWRVGDELVFPDSRPGYNVDHWNFKYLDSFAIPGETETIAVESLSFDGEQTAVELSAPAAYTHLLGGHVAMVSRSVVFQSAEGAEVLPCGQHMAMKPTRAHIIHAGTGSFDFRYARVLNMGRTTTDMIDSTTFMDEDHDTHGDGRRGGTYIHAAPTVMHQGCNQVARYPVHVHHGKSEVFWEGNVVLGSPRVGMTCHDSRCFIRGNVIVGANGTSIFTESGTETGEVVGNFLIGTGGGSREGDDGRFANSEGIDFAHGGFGFWGRGPLMNVSNNNAEGIFGMGPYAFFVHSSFQGDAIIPDVPGTPEALRGEKALTASTSFQTYGAFTDNTAFGSWRSAIAVSYSTPNDSPLGNHILRFKATALGIDGQLVHTTHAGMTTLDSCLLQGYVADNTLIGLWQNNGLSTQMDVVGSTLKNLALAVRAFSKGHTITDTVFENTAADFRFDLNRSNVQGFEPISISSYNGVDVTVVPSPDPCSSVSNCACAPTCADGQVCVSDCSKILDGFAISPPAIVAPGGGRRSNDDDFVQEIEVISEGSPRMDPMKLNVSDTESRFAQTL